MTRDPVGTSYDPLTPPDRDDPYAAFARLHADGPSVAYSGVLDAHLVTRYDDVVRAAADTSRLSSSAATAAPDLPAAVRDVLARAPAYAVCRPMVSTDPPAHPRLRRHLARALARRATRMEPWLRRTCDEMVATFEARGGADLLAAFCTPLPLATIMALLDVPAGHRRLVERGSNAMVALQWGGRGIDDQLRWADDIVAFHECFATLLAARRETPGDDLISDIATLSGDGPALSSDEAVRQLTGLFTAGHETTANLIAHAVLWLLASGGWTRLAEDPTTAGAVVEETLRIDGPVTGMFRRTTAAVEIGGFTVPAGARVQLVYGAANRDPAHFAQPGRFDPDRAAGPAHLAFGSGAHFCIGATLARLEARVALQTLARRLPDLRLAGGFVPRYRPNAAFRGPREVRVEWTPVDRSAAGSAERS